MFLILTSYKKPIAEIDQHLAAHRAFLEEGYQKNYFVVSGPCNPRSGGVIISQLNDKTQLEDFLKNDPFIVHDLAHYDVKEFYPVKYHRDFAAFVV